MKAKTQTGDREIESLIDDCFYIKRQRWGTFVSVHKDGHEVITSLTEEQCIATTRFYLKGLQDGFKETKTYDGVVGGKL